MSATDVKSKITAAVTAQEAGDYATALTYLRSARMLLLAIPDIRHGQETVTFRVEDIDAMIRDLQRAQGASAGIQSIPITYKRTGDE